MNGLGVSLKALADTGANGYLFVNRSLARRLKEALGVELQQLPYTVPIRGYQNKVQSHVSQYIRLHLSVDGRRIYNCPFVVLDLGNQDVIIGIKFMRRMRLRLDTGKTRFIWPPEYPPTPVWRRDLILELPDRHDINYQADANRRDQEFEKNRWRNSKSKAPRRAPITITQLLSNPLSTNRNSTDSTTNKIKTVSRPVGTKTAAPAKIFKKVTVPRKPPDYKATLNRPRPSFICQISANAFHYNMKRKDTEFFQTSLYEIDRVLESLDENTEDQETLQLIKEKLPSKYDRYADVFSKSESDRLPPHRAYDHKIQLEAPLPNAYSPLYRQSADELRATKQYLLENLNKGFIVNSQSPFASPVLFVKKLDGRLRFYVDYRRLN